MINGRDEKEITPIKENVSWQDVDNFISSLKNYIKLNQFNCVYGPARGGLIFAVMISHRYNLPFLGAPQKGCICVDDIIDSGATALAWKNKGYNIVSMYYKPNDFVKPDYYYKEKDDKWVYFPWE